MAKPVAAYVQLPTDGTNTGKQVRTQTQVIGGQTVHTHFFVPVSDKTIEGIYYADPGPVQTIQATAQNGTSTGFWWLFNPTASTVRLGIKRVKMTATITATTVFVTLPRVLLSTCTFTGTPSGGAIAAAKRASADAAPQAYYSLAATGATVTLVAAIHSSIPPPVTSTAPGVAVPIPQEYLLMDDATADGSVALTVSPGEGMVLYQPDAGTAADTRKFDTDVTWSEFDAT